MFDNNKMSIKWKKKLNGDKMIQRTKKNVQFEKRNVNE